MRATSCLQIIATAHSPRFPAPLVWILLRTAVPLRLETSIMTGDWKSFSRIATLRRYVCFTTSSLRLATRSHSGLRGYKSNRDAIGAAVTVETGKLRQTKYLQAGSGFLSQHSKELFFGVGNPDGPIRATVRWPNGESQHFGICRSTIVSKLAKVEAHLKQSLSASHRLSMRAPGDANPPESLPSQIETWLIDPLKAPGFPLPDLAWKSLDLKSLQGGLVLLVFWATTAPASLEQFEGLSWNICLAWFGNGFRSLG